MKCKHCNDTLDCEHQCEHPALCCDCFDLSWFPEALDRLNAERARVSRAPMPAWIKPYLSACHPRSRK